MRFSIIASLFLLITGTNAYFMEGYGFDFAEGTDAKACDEEVLSAIVEAVAIPANRILAKLGIEHTDAWEEVEITHNGEPKKNLRELVSCAHCNWACPHNIPLCYGALDCCNAYPQCSNGACNRRRMFESMTQEERSLVQTGPAENMIKSVVREGLKKYAKKIGKDSECGRALLSATARAEVKIF